MMPFCDKEEDQHNKDKTGDEIPEDIAFKQQRLEKIQAAKKSLETGEKAFLSVRPALNRYLKNRTKHSPLTADIN